MAAREQFRQLAGSHVLEQVQVQAPSHSPYDRLAKLPEMVGRGQISQDEFDAKRQQILDEL